MEHPLEVTGEINNSFYDEYGDRWYTAYDDPVALLRAENQTKFPWILNKLKALSFPGARILDVGCGGGFLSNELACHDFKVTGVDLSPESLKVACQYDKTKTVIYEVADAYQLPFSDEAFDVVTAMDFLEHVEGPEKVIKEFSRVLKPGGLFFFHTFNRNFLSWLIVIKLLEWFVKNTPKNMHVLNLFIKPRELSYFCESSGMKVLSCTGIRPVFTSIDWNMIKTGVVSKNMRFTLTKGLLLSYMGVARKTTNSTLSKQHFQH
ncbi:MAG: bifunctional 2-polyprenyl-6-hydroxyphenol methylase/3-demethylubiquinol 3-O-methyltransferase UbiG [Bacteriovoracia bacterium]